MSDVRPAFQGGMMLAGWTNNHNTGPKVSFWLETDEDLEAFKHLTARKGRTAGQRFYAVLVQIGDNEEPIEPGTDTAPKQSHALSRSAALMCSNSDFHEYMGTLGGWLPEAADAREEMAANYVRNYCRIDSRAELDTSPTAQQLFARLMGEYRDWRHVE